MLPHAALLLSSTFERSGRWLSGRGGIFYGKFGLRGSDFKEAVGLRLLVPPVTDLASVHRRCSCGFVCVGIQDDFHLKSCSHSGWFTTNKHDAVRDLLKELIEVCDAGAVVQKEFDLQTTKGSTQIVRSDLYVELGVLTGLSLIHI